MPKKEPTTTTRSTPLNYNPAKARCRYFAEGSSPLRHTLLLPPRGPHRLGAPLASHDVSIAFVIDAVVCVVNAKHVKQYLDEVKPDGALVR
jgi:hypothetical protein